MADRSKVHKTQIKTSNLLKPHVQKAVEIGSGYGYFHHTAYNAAAYAVLNRPEEAVRWLESAAETGSPNYAYFEIDRTSTIFENIRVSSRSCQN